MPLVSVTLKDRYDDEVKQRLCSALAGTVEQVLGAAGDSIVVTVNDVSQQTDRGGAANPSQAQALNDPEALVRRFLTLMERRDLTAASAMLADRFTITFPGSVTMTDLSELVAWTSTRYQSVQKTYERFDIASGQRGPTVYCYGILSGTWRDGAPFDGIRFIDRFETEGAKLTRQDVWNDMGEMRRV